MPLTTNATHANLHGLISPPSRLSRMIRPCIVTLPGLMCLFLAGAGRRSNWHVIVFPRDAVIHQYLRRLWLIAFSTEQSPLCHREFGFYGGAEEQNFDAKYKGQCRRTQEFTALHLRANWKSPVGLCPSASCVLESVSVCTSSDMMELFHLWLPQVAFLSSPEIFRNCNGNNGRLWVFFPWYTKCHVFHLLLPWSRRMAQPLLIRKIPYEAQQHILCSMWEEIMQSGAKMCNLNFAAAQICQGKSLFPVNTPAAFAGSCCGFDFQRFMIIFFHFLR